MKNIARNGIIAWAILAICATGFAAETKIGYVDLKKAFDKYYKTVQSNASLKEEAADMEREGKDMVENGKKQEDEWKRLMDKANDQSLSAEEREKSKKAAEEKLLNVKNTEQAITEYERVSRAKLFEKERQRRDAIVAEIRVVLEAKAKAAGYTLVLDSSGESGNATPIVLYT